MAQTAPEKNSPADDRHLRTSVSFLDLIARNYPTPPFSVRLWDGTTWDAGDGASSPFVLVLKHPGALRSMFWPPNQLTLGEAYVYDDIDIEGDIGAVFPLADWLTELRWGFAERMRFGRLLLKLPAARHPLAGLRRARLHGNVHSRERDSQAVTYHYDLSNDFYRLWLDSRMVYSCAYFTSPEQTLEEAQEQKLDYICRKLRLKPGERFLDIGCGWGGLLIHAGRNYGVEGVGITLSRPQAELAGERIRDAGLSGSCRVEVCDYRDLEGREWFDKVASVGMCEHVGEARLRDYFAKAWSLLRPGGVFLNHGIAASPRVPFPKGPSFVDRYVFPDGELLPVNTTLRAAEECGFEVRDLENLREHYALTLRHWVRRLEARHEEALRTTDEVTWRIWRLYMAGSAYGFTIGRMNLFQTLLAKPDRGSCGLPLTRDDWY